MLSRLAFLVVAGAATASAQVAPCTHPVAACERWITVGKGPSRSMVYGSYSLTTPNRAITRALIMVHGAGRNADHYFETAMAAAFLAGALDNTIVLAPRFAAGNDSVKANEIKWPERGSNWRSGGRVEADTTITSFDFVDEIVRKLADKKVFPNLKNVVVAGHSAGGQYATRYEMANRIHGTLGVAMSYVVANPSSYAWPVADRPLMMGNADTTDAYKEALGPNGEKVNGNFTYGPFDTTRVARTANYNRWPSGLDSLTGYAAATTRAQLVKQLIERPTTYLLGQVDVLPLGGFDSSPNAMAQGPTRRARGEAFFTYVNQKLGAKHHAIIVPECGHNDRCIFTTNIVFPSIFPPATP